MLVEIKMAGGGWELLLARSSLVQGDQLAPSSASCALDPREAVILLESTPWWQGLEEAMSELLGWQDRTL